MSSSDMMEETNENVKNEKKFQLKMQKRINEI